MKFVFNGMHLPHSCMSQLCPIKISNLRFKVLYLRENNGLMSRKETEVNFLYGVQFLHLSLYSCDQMELAVTLMTSHYMNHLITYVANETTEKYFFSRPA